MNALSIQVSQPEKSMAVLVLAGLLFFSNLAVAQNTSADEQRRLSAVMSVVTNFILNDRLPPIEEPVGERVDVALGELSTDTYAINDSWYVAFELQYEDVEICLDLAADMPIDHADLIVSLNGEVITLVTLGENCFAIPQHQQRKINYLHIQVLNPALNLSASRLQLSSANPTEYGMRIVTRGGWDEIAVRKVIRIFAFGGHAKDQQIQVWADMIPRDAINQMLTFDQHNLLLSPLAPGEQYDDVATDHGTLTEFINFLSDPNSDLPIPASNREQYGIDNYNFDDGFARMASVRGLNPFRQRIGFWETNYHLAVNLDAAVSRPQLATYYDTIMTAHEAGLPYSQVMGVAAKSAAIAMQYGHRNNQWVFDDFLGEYVCECNDDFAREIHQLFYGIFGADDPNHEDGTIRETAKMLTDMRVPYITNVGFDTMVHFETDDHHIADLTILGQTISGADASAKIDNLMPFSMQHPESLRNLPVMIISTLADDNLTQTRSDELRTTWAAMGANRTLLEFLRVYAISKQFHAAEQFKYSTSHERALYIANKNNLDNFEAYISGDYYDGGRAGRDIDGVPEADAAGEFFRPSHNVFGGQTALEASDSALAFEQNYNELVEQEYRLRDAAGCDTCNQGQPWKKKWANVLPQRPDGNFYVADVAQWLWKQATGSLRNYSTLEQAHLYFLLGAARRAPNTTYDQSHVVDLPLLMCIVEDYQRKQGVSVDISLANLMSNSVAYNYCVNWDDNNGGEYTDDEKIALNRFYTGADIENNAILQGLLAELAQQTLPLETTQGTNGGADLRQHARERVNNALAFIFTTPFIFAEAQ